MKTFVCLLTMVTVFFHVQNRKITDEANEEGEEESSIAEEMLRDFCKN